MVAIAVYAYTRSGAAALGAVIAARLLPAMFAAPLTGRLLDRYDRRAVIAAAAGAEAVCLAVAAGLMLGGSRLVPVAALLAVGAAFATAARPGLEALLPALATTPEELTVATAAWSACDNAGFLLGSGAGGAALAAIAPGALVAVAAASVALAAGVTMRLRPTWATAPVETSGGEPAETDGDGPLSELLAGLRTVFSMPILRAPFALLAGSLLLEGTTDVQLVALAIHRLGMGTGGPGILYAVCGVGGVLASAVLLPIVRHRGFGLALGFGALVFAAGLVLSGLAVEALAIVAMIPVGIGFGLVEAAVMAIVPRLADDAVVGRVYGVAEVLYTGMAGVGALLAPLLIAALGTAGSLIAVGAAFAAGTAIAWRVCSRLDVNEARAGRVRELLRGIPFLTPLPLPRLERLVRSARPLHAGPEEAIVRAGEPGDQFFVIEHGTVSIEEYGRRQGAGTGFGEIALLREVPRTATVRAIDAVDLWTVERSVFLGAVGGEGDARHVADAVVAEHLSRTKLSAAGLDGGSEPPGGASAPHR